MAYAARGRPAVSASRPEVALHRLAQGQLDLDGLPEWLDPWVRSTMAADPNVRPTPEEIRSWITGRSLPTAETVPELVQQTWVAPTVVAPVPDEATRVLEQADDARLERRSTLTALRWGSALVMVAVSLAVGLLAPLLLVLLVTVGFTVVGVFVMLVRDRNQEKGFHVPPTWSFALAAPIALGAGLSTVIGIFGAIIALFVLLVLFFLFGGDFG